MISNTQQALMEKLKAKTLDEKGVTLIELLITIVISAILLPVTYGVLITGYKVYEKVSIDAQLKEDADYVSSMVMKELYSYPFDEVESCATGTTPCIKFVNNLKTDINKNNSNFYTITKETVESNSKVPKEVTLILVETDNSKWQWRLNNHLLTTKSNFEGSNVSITCKEKIQCKEGLLKFDYAVSHPRLARTLNLESSFGF